jgi:hypothetical protein
VADGRELKLLTITIITIILAVLTASALLSVAVGRILAAADSRTVPYTIDWDSLPWDDDPLVGTPVEWRGDPAPSSATTRSA